MEASCIHAEHARTELQRQSDLKNKAFKEGMIRPFLLLVSMSPTDRASMASSLGIDLSPCHGDAHAESWCLINRNVTGIQARANRAFTESLNPWASNCNWYEVVERVAARAFADDTMRGRVDKDVRREIERAGGLGFKHTIGACCDPADPLPQRMEELFMRAFHQVLISHLHEEQMRELVELTRSEEARRLKERLSAAGWTDPALIDWTVGLALLELREKVPITSQLRQLEMSACTQASKRAMY